MNGVIVGISNRIATVIHNANPEETSSVERLTALLALRILNYGAVICALIIGLLTNVFWETLIVVVTVVFLRINTGGYHFSSLDTCFMVSSAILSIIPHINVESTMIFNLFSIIIVGVFSEKRRLIPCVLIVLNFAINDSEIAIAATVQALSLIKWRR